MVLHVAMQWIDINQPFHCEPKLVVEHDCRVPDPFGKDLQEMVLVYGCICLQIFAQISNLANVAIRNSSQLFNVMDVKMWHPKYHSFFLCSQVWCWFQRHFNGNAPVIIACAHITVHNKKCHSRKGHYQELSTITLFQLKNTGCAKSFHTKGTMFAITTSIVTLSVDVRGHPLFC